MGLAGKVRREFHSSRCGSPLSQPFPTGARDPAGPVRRRLSRMGLAGKVRREFHSPGSPRRAKRGAGRPEARTV